MRLPSLLLYSASSVQCRLERLRLSTITSITLYGSTKRVLVIILLVMSVRSDSSSDSGGSFTSGPLPALTFFGNPSAAVAHRRLWLHTRASKSLRQRDILNPASLRVLAHSSVLREGVQLPAILTSQQSASFAQPEVSMVPPASAQPVPVPPSPPAFTGGLGFGPDVGSAVAFQEGGGERSSPPLALLASLEATKWAYIAPATETSHDAMLATIRGYIQ